MVLREDDVETVLILAAVALEFDSCFTQLPGNAAGGQCGDPVRCDVCKGQRAGQPAEVLSGHDCDSVLWVGRAINRLPPVREPSENGVLPSSREEMALVGAIVRNDQFFFVTIVALAALMGPFEVKRRQPGGARLPTLPTSARSFVERPPGKSVDDFGVCQFVSLHRGMATAEFIYAKSVSALSPASRSRLHEW